MHVECTKVRVKLNFETTVLKLRLCDDSDTHMLKKETKERNKEIIFKDWTLFIDCISEINSAACNTKYFEIAVALKIIITLFNWSRL